MTIEGSKRASKRDEDVVAAKKIVEPINRHVAAWQSSAIRLAARAQKIQSTGSSTADLLTDAQSLATTVRSELRKLKSQLVTVPPDQANSTYVLDTMQALNSIISTVEHAMSMVRADEPGRV